jgi:hypothetical protein
VAGIYTLADSSTIQLFMLVVSTSIDCSKSASQDQHKIKQEGYEEEEE